MKRNLHRLLPFIFLALLAAACSKTEPKQVSSEKETVKPVSHLTGEALFNEKCRICHTVKDQGGVVGPNLSTVGSKRDAVFIDHVIRDASQSFPGTVMPPFSSFSATQIASLVEYLGSLK
jgi:L-cysteine S-thiosulfotransferase